MRRLLRPGVDKCTPASSTRSARATLTIAALCGLAGTVPIAQRYQENAPRYAISGRIADARGLWSSSATLMLGARDGATYSVQPVSITESGAFVTPRVRPGVYVLEVIRSTPDGTNPPRTIGFTLVTIADSDASNVVVELRHDTALTGVFRMATDDPGAAWPTSIVVNAYLAVDQAPMFAGVVADGAAGGKFVLRNAFGPRVLRCGYGLAPNSPWWPSRVLLDGRDITNVPTDFSAHDSATLEVWFTQHPSRISGVVTTADGQPVRASWVLISSADHALQQEWASTNDATQANTVGRFSIPVLPGAYVLRALPQAAFDSYQSARRQILRLAPGGTKISVGNDREIANIRLTVRP